VLGRIETQNLPIYRSASLEIFIFQFLIENVEEILPFNFGKLKIIYLRNWKRHSGLLRFWTLSVVRYSKEHNISETGCVSVLRPVGGHILLGSLEKANHNQSETCSVEYRMMDKVQKPS
jgi:hypothetical protein